jgi:hypothetical protein
MDCNEIISGFDGSRERLDEIKQVFEQEVTNEKVREKLPEESL